MDKLSYLIYLLLFTLTQNVTQKQVLNCVRGQLGRIPIGYLHMIAPG